MRGLSYLKVPFTPVLEKIVMVLAVLVGSSSCSFLYDLGTAQCQRDSDCQALGGDFTGLVCQEALCVPPTKPKPKPTETTDAGVEDAGDGSVPCTSNQQCIEEHFDRPYICRQGKCIDLYTPECPVVLQAQNLKVPEPIIIGAYSSINNLNKEGGPITRAYNLALDEFTDKIDGLPGGPNGTRRKLVAIVCEGAALSEAPLENSLSHLIDTVQVPAIVASLFPDDLREAFESRAKQDNVFFISPLAADSSLTTGNNDGLLWFMLGAYRDLATTMVPLVERAEAFQRKTLDDSTPTRVALVQGSLAPAQDLGQILLSDPEHSLVFNGKAALDNDDNFQFLELVSSFEDNSAEANAAIAALEAFQPHIIVVTAGTEFTTKVMPVLEANWDESAETGQIRPFYVFGPLLAVDSTLLNTSNASVRRRLAGVNFASAEDHALYNMYKANYQAMYPGETFYDTENYYDSVYYLTYAIAAAGTPAKLNGDDIAAGMERLVSPSGMSLSVGPSSISDVLATLAVPNSRINLKGTLGPSDFNLGTGSRVARGSVWCVTPQPGYLYDVLRPNETTNELEGTFPCFSGF